MSDQLQQAIDLGVAQEILRQLGGRRFVAMTGAKGFTSSDNSLSFSLPNARTRSGAKVNRVRIMLTSADDYTIATYFVRGSYARQVDCQSGVYNDNLQAVFTSMTGLHTRL